MTGVPVQTAMLLAAGRGERMRPLTDKTAKPLVKVAGRALIDYVLDILKSAGIRRVIINIHWCGHKVKAHISQRDDLNIIISDESDILLDTGGAIARAAPLLGDEPILVVNSDAFWMPPDPEPLYQLARQFDPALMDEILLLADTGHCLGFEGPGDFARNETGVLARPGTGKGTPSFAYAGMRITHPRLYTTDCPNGPFSARHVWDGLIRRERMHGLVLPHFWLHIGNPDAVQAAQSWLYRQQQA